jgi:hypothetical protein
VTPRTQKHDADGNRFINDETFMDERKSSSTTIPVAMANLKMQKNNGEHMLIPVTAKMIHSALSTNKTYLS